MTKADRVTKRLERQRAKDDAAARAQREADWKQAEAAAAAEIRVLVPQVLRRLKALGWPDAQIIRTQGKLDMSYRRAAWVLGTRPLRPGDTKNHLPYFLLSNGRFAYGLNGARERSASRLTQVPNVEILKGLHDLADRHGFDDGHSLESG
jgi:hypothetical protein